MLLALNRVDHVEEVIARPSRLHIDLKRAIALRWVQPDSGPEPFGPRLDPLEP